MSAVEKIKAAATELSPNERYELFHWWTGSNAFRERQIAALKRDIAVGIASLDSGRYQTFDDTNVMRLAGDIGQVGRERPGKSD